jgi:hypothetical protein
MAIKGGLVSLGEVIAVHLGVGRSTNLLPGHRYLHVAGADLGPAERHEGQVASDEPLFGVAGRISSASQAAASSGERHGGRNAHAASEEGTRDVRQVAAGSDGAMLASGVPARARRVPQWLAPRWCRHGVSQPRPGRMRNDRSRMSPSLQQIAAQAAVRRKVEALEGDATARNAADPQETSPSDNRAISGTAASAPGRFAALGRADPA